MSDGRRRPLAVATATLLAGLLGLTGCGGGSTTPAGTSAARPQTASSADGDFVRHMRVHHERALQLGQAALDHGTDQRVRDFGRRILTEQTPERGRLDGWVGALRLTPQPVADSMQATGYVTDARYRQLVSEPGPRFDRDVLLLSASSEDGAVTMAEAELRSGTYPPARELATSIAGAKNSEIPELRRLAAQLPA
jgi:uncharacterized protein (DUF305 family)